jgi:Mrp family chromosome partitioning ATPase
LKIHSIHTDIISIDCPSILPSAYETTIASLVDGILTMVRSGVSKGRIAQATYKELLSCRAKQIGAILVDEITTINDMINNTDFL